MTDGKMERPELRGYLTHLFSALHGGLVSVQESIADEGVDNSGIIECLTEMVEVVGDLLSKVKHDVRLKDTWTCEECFHDFNDTGRAERFCSDSCEDRYNDELDEQREEDCS